MTTTNIVSAPHIGVDNHGHGICIWQGAVGGVYRVQASITSDSGANWSAPVSISADDDNALRPQLAMVDNGYAICVWEKNTYIQAARTDDYGSSWYAETTLSEANNTEPQLDLDASGNGICVWSNNVSINPSQSRYTSNYGSSWAAAIDLPDSSKSLVYTPLIAMVDNGNGIAAWTKNDGSNNRVQVAYTSSAGGSWSSAITLSPAGDTIGSVAIASIDDGSNGICVWSRRIDSGIIIEAALTANAGQTWSSTATTLSDTSTNSLGPDVSIDSSGNSVAIWRHDDGSNDIAQAIALVDVNFNVSDAQSLANFWLTREISKRVSWSDVFIAESYNIYRNAALTDLVTSISTSATREYTLNRAKKGEVYYITWENGAGSQVDATPITVD